MASGSDERSLADSSQSRGMIIKPLLEFTSKIFKPFAGKENVVLSPISIHKALSMVLLGTDDNTETKDELLETLGLKKLNEKEFHKCLFEYSALIAEFKKITEESKELIKEREKHQDPCAGQWSSGPPVACLSSNRFSKWQPPILDTFNMIITKGGGDLLPAYERKVKKYFDSSIVKVDDERPETKSEVLSKLNGWAKEAGFSQPIMTRKELDDAFSAYVMSAIRVQGFWFDDFDEHEEKSSPIFYNHGKKDQSVKGNVLFKSHPQGAKYLELTSADKAKYVDLHDRLSRSNSADLFEELSSLNIQVAQVALQGNLSFTIFEPLNPSGSGGELDKLLNQLMHTDKTSGSNKFEKVFSLLDSEVGANRISHIRFPKFGFENEIDMKDHLQSIGLHRAFSIRDAQISKMTAQNVYIEKITHQAMIDVNKFGIKAAGFTIIKMMARSARRATKPINVDIKNPFLFTIRYGKLPLFIGRLDKLNK